jgi:hypothetical protein
MVLTPDDRDRLRLLHDERDPRAFAERLFDYYHDADRADRTPRELLYLHLGMATAMIEQALRAPFTPTKGRLMTKKEPAAGFPPCVPMTLEWNPHAAVYMTVEQWLAAEAARGNTLDWVSAEERDRAVRLDSLWITHWYPNTPVSFQQVAASSLLVLQAAMEATLRTGAS